MVTDDIEALRHRIGFLDFLELGNGGGCINSVIKTHYRLQACEVDRAIDVEPIASRVARECPRHPPFDPAVAQHRIVARVGRIHEVDRILGLFGFFELFGGVDKRPLRFGIGLAGNQLGLFVDIAQAVEHRGHPPLAIANGPALLDVASHVLRRQLQRVLQVDVRLDELLVAEPPFAPTMRHRQQPLDPALLMAFEMTSDRIRIDQ